MAVGNSNNAAFYSISNGKICRQFNSPDADTKERVNKNNKVVYEKFYDFIDGLIVDIATKDSEYGKSWMVTLEDEEGRYVLQMPYSSGYSGAFLRTLPNMELSHKVKLTPKLSMEGDKKKTTLFINQHGKALKHFYTKDNPNGIPELGKVKIKGKITFDDSEIMEYLEAMVNKEILPKLLKKGSKPAPPEVEEEDLSPAPF